VALDQKIGVLFLQLVQSFFRIIGLKGTRIFARSLGNFFYYFIPIRKEVVFKNLSTAFPEKKISELKKIARRAYQNITTTFTELLLFTSLSKDEMRAMGHIENLAEIQSIVDENKGVIFWSGHIGSWEAGGSVLGLAFEKKINGLAKKQSNSAMNEIITKAREAHGNKIIWLGVSVRQLIEVLRDGGLVCVVGDQRGPSDNPRINFFGKPTPFYTGAATIINKTKCNVVLCASIRKDDGNYKGVLEKLDTSNLPEKQEDRIIEINQRCANFLEKVIRQYPDQYFWMHKIWKY